MSDDLLGLGSALVVVAHPDDAEFSAGGTIARFAQAGASVWVCVVTNGAAGSRDPQMTREKLAAIRVQEQERASQALGAKEVFFLGYEDAYLTPSIEVRTDIARLIRTLRPDLVITHDPTRWYAPPRYINHPDHRATGEATLAAIMPTANTRLASVELMQEGLEPYDVKAVWLATPVDADHWVDVSGVLDLKVEALLHHKSQVSERVGEFVRARAEQAAAGSGYTHAEAFRSFSFA